MCEHGASVRERDLLDVIVIDGLTQAECENDTENLCHSESNTNADNNLHVRVEILQDPRITALKDAQILYNFLVI